MPLGSSAGRSSGNRTGAGARRRSTPAEKAGRVPPEDAIEHVHVPEVEARWPRHAVVTVSIFAVGMLLQGVPVVFIHLIGLLLIGVAFGYSMSRWPAEHRLKLGRRIRP